MASTKNMISWLPIVIGPLVATYNYLNPAPKMFWPNWGVLVSLFVGVNVAYNAVNWFLSNHSERYNRMSASRRAYTLKNIVKAVYLAWLAAYMTPTALDTTKGIWANYDLHMQSLMYAIPDLVGVMRVPDLRTTTYIHHSIVVGLSMFAVRFDFSTDMYWKWHVVYGYLSATTWMVNLFLGSWRLFKPGSTVRWFAKISLLNYVVVLAVNWAWQVYWFATHLTYEHIPNAWVAASVFLGVMILFAIAVDDVDLASSLMKHSKGRIVSSLDKKEKEDDPPITQQLPHVDSSSALE